jgi:prevent-host-death family protein
MRTFSIDEAKTQLSELIEAVTQGEEIAIAKAGKPAAMLVPMPAKKTVRQPGAMRGKIKIAGDVDSPLPDDLQAAFEGRNDGNENPFGHIRMSHPKMKKG